MSNARKKKSKTPFVVQDHYFHEAKRLGYRARSAFKLLEIDERFHVLRPGMKVLDLASAPGSWLQVIAKSVGPKWQVVGIDIQRIEPLGRGNVTVFQGDVFDFAGISAFLDTVGIERFDCVTSDIAPATTGITGVDQYRSVELNLAILDVADRFLRTGGNLILKVFVGEDVNDLIGPIKERYETLRRIKPRACRDRSFEEYFLCEKKKAKSSD